MSVIDNASDTGSQTGREHSSDRPRRIPKSKIEGIDTNGKKIHIFYRPSGPQGGLVPLTDKLPLEAATVFCNSIRDAVNMNEKYYTIPGDDPKPYKAIFDWILNDCIPAGNDVKFPDVEEPAGNPFGPALEIMVAAEALGIPEGSLVAFMKKRLTFLARKELIDLDLAARFYDFDDYEYGGMGLGEVASTSIFEAWWNAKLEGPEHTEYMCKLYDLRQEIPQLDEDLHNAVAKKKDFIEQKKAERKAQRGQKPTENSNDSGFNPEAGDEAPAAAIEAVGGWDAPVNAGTSVNNVNTKGGETNGFDTHAAEKQGWMHVSQGHADKGVNSWADQMNDDSDHVEAVPAKIALW